MSQQLPPVSLIHIGLPKTATTYLQTQWLHDPQVCLVKDGLLPLIHEARKAGKEGTRPSRAVTAPPIGFDSQPQPGQKLVLSNEALSNAYINERADKAQIQSFQEHAAIRVKSAVAKSKVLLVVREPGNWILSLYNQAIKQGGVDTLPQFLRREHDYIEQSLNIRELFNTWKQHYGSGNVLILPLELLRDDEAAFFTEIEKFAGIPAPRERVPATRNPSLQEGHLDLMRQFNKWVELFREHGEYQGTLPPDLQQALSTMHFATRYMLERPTPGLDRRLRRLERGMTVQHLSRDDLPRDLLKAIRSGNAKQLKKDKLFGYRDLYT